MKQRILNILIAIDQLLCVLLTLDADHPDETISAASYRMEQQGKLAGRLLRPLIDALFRPLERDHCWLSFESEVRGAHLPSTTTVSESGCWQITEVTINRDLPTEQHMRFSGLSIYAVQ